MRSVALKKKDGLLGGRSKEIASLKICDRPPNGAERFTSVYRAPSEIRDIAKGSRVYARELVSSSMKVHAPRRGSGNPLGA